MDHDDTAWCPVCDRAIAPKRWVEPINPPPPPPPSPTANNTVRRAKVVGKKGGLVHGTGRVRPNGSLKRTPSPPQPQTTPAQTTVAVNNEAKYRLHIDLGPTPLYCSDECQLADINRGRLPIDFNPDRQQTSSSPVTYPDHDSQCSSIESQSSMDSTTSQESSSSQSHVSPSLAKLAAHYNFGPLPPPAPIDDSESDSEPSFNNDFTGGVIMAARRMRSELLPPPRKRNEYGKLVSEPRKPIPGWTDGSNAWREATYNMSTKTPASAFTARSSNGIPSTLSRSWTKPTLTRPVTSSPVVATSQSDAELLSRFSNSYTRSPSSVSLSTSPSPSSMPPLSPPKKERSLVKKGAEGKLLVPDVKMRLPASASSTSLASMSSAPSRRTVRSPLSQSSSSEAEACDLRSSFFDRRPKIETRSWSYDNVKTYPIMELPPKKVIEKRKQKKVVDGVEVEVEIEVEVEVQEKRKRLFLFAPVTTIRA